jgi:hypothetical protein
MMEIWNQNGLFTAHDFKEMQDRCDQIVLPPGYESLSGVVISQFSFCTGAQWKCWTMVASVYALKDILPSADYSIWMTFVNACRSVVKPLLTLEDAKNGQDLFVKFGEEVATQYTSKNVTPNMHFHTHTFEFIDMFSSIYNFWLYSYERYNKILKNINTNNKGLYELTIANKFTKRKNANEFIRQLEDKTKGPVYLRPEHASFLTTISGYSKETKFTKQEPSEKEMKNFYRLSTFDYLEPVTGSEPVPLYEAPKGKDTTMNLVHFQLLKEYYETFAYPDKASNITILPQITRKEYISIAGQRYNSVRCSSAGGPYISAFFQERLIDSVASYPGKVEYFFENDLIIDGKCVTHRFCFVRWFKSMGNVGQKYEEAGLEFWRDESEALDKFAILPIQRIYNHVGAVHFISTHRTATNKKVLIIPLEKKMYV